jgi:hypothetical protein
VIRVGVPMLAAVHRCGISSFTLLHSKVMVFGNPKC